MVWCYCWGWGLYHAGERWSPQSRFIVWAHCKSRFLQKPHAAPWTCAPAQWMLWLVVWACAAIYSTLPVSLSYSLLVLEHCSLQASLCLINVLYTPLQTLQWTRHITFYFTSWGTFCSFSEVPIQASFDAVLSPFNKSLAGSAGLPTFACSVNTETRDGWQHPVNTIQPQYYQQCRTTIGCPFKSQWMDNNAYSIPLWFIALAHTTLVQEVIQFHTVCT